MMSTVSRTSDFTTAATGVRVGSGVGNIVEGSEGTLVGSGGAIPSGVGGNDGCHDGTGDGSAVVGGALGTSKGASDGAKVGQAVSAREGRRDGEKVGVLVVGEFEPPQARPAVPRPHGLGAVEGTVVGTADGSCDGVDA